LVVYDIPGIKLRTWFLPPIYLPIWLFFLQQGDSSSDNIPLPTQVS
jgi:hypothetical protein